MDDMIIFICVFSGQGRNLSCVHIMGNYLMGHNLKPIVGLFARQLPLKE